MTLQKQIIKILDQASNLGKGDKWAVIQIIRLVGWTAPSTSLPQARRPGSRLK